LEHRIKKIEDNQEKMETVIEKISDNLSVLVRLDTKIEHYIASYEKTLSQVDDLVSLKFYFKGAISIISFIIFLFFPVFGYFISQNLSYIDKLRFDCNNNKVIIQNLQKKLERVNNDK